VWHNSRTMRHAVGLLVIGTLVLVAGASTEELLQRPWPRERRRTLEVGRTAVVWREATRPDHRLFAGADLTVPADLDTAWRSLSDARALGPMTPGVARVDVLEETETHRLVQVTIALRTLLGTRTMQLRYAMDQQPKEWMAFRLVEHPYVAYRGRLDFATSEGGTRLALATELQPRVRIPTWLLRWVERRVVLGGIRAWLRALAP